MHARQHVLISHLPISLTICMVIQSAITLIFVTSPVCLALLLAHINEDSHGLDLSVRTLQHMYLKFLHDKHSVKGPTTHSC